MLPFGVTIPATVPQWSEIPEGLMNKRVCIYFDSLYVSSNLVLIIRRVNCINTTSGICHSVLVTVRYAGRVLPDLHTGRCTVQGDICQILY
jgi:hypothetical protein